MKNHWITHLKDEDKFGGSLEQLLFAHIQAWLQKKEKRPIFIGLNAPQGAGKTTLCKRLIELSQSSGFKALAISIDDFYLTRTEQQELADEYPKNPYLQKRGYPGTHDIELGLDVLNKLSLQKENIEIPRYDKSAFKGLGDRGPKELIQNPIDIIILEGWLLGYSPVAERKVIDPGLMSINQYLFSYQKWLRFLDCFIYLAPKEIDYFIDWRVEAEKKQNNGMKEKEVREYAKLFLPAYDLYSKKLCAEPPIVGPSLKLTLNKDRSF